MRPFFIYIIELFLCSGLFLLLYRWIIVRKVNYGFCRKYLVIAMLLSATIPVFNVPLYPPQTIYMRVPVMAQPQPQVQTPAQPLKTETEREVQTAQLTRTVSPTVYATLEPATQVTASRMPSEQKWRIFFLSLYGAGFILSLFLVFYGIIAVLRLKRTSKVTHTPEYDLAESEQVTTPFSFMHTVYMGSETDLKTCSHILSHESSHVRHHHSVEKLIMSFLRSLLWFNPFMWIAEKRLEEVQEWQADHDALADGYNLAEYRLSILKQLFGCNPEMTSGLNSSLTKQRFLQMKQPEIKGGAASQTIATTLLAATLFFCFGCRPTYGQFELPDGNQRTNSMIFFTTQFFNDKDVSKRADHYYSQKSADNKTVIENISIYENYNGQSLWPCVVAVNGIRTANSISDKKLDWVNESTAIFINGNRKTFEELQALDDGKDLTVYYFKPKSKRAQKKYGFVYINYGTPVLNDSHYFNPVAIDNPNLDIPDIVSVIADSNPYGGTLFTYNCKGVRVAAPEMKYAVDGMLVDIQTFLNARSGQSGSYTTVYRNNAAKDRFGKDVWEVVDLHFNRKGLYVKFDFDENGEVHPFIGNDPKVKSTDDEIRAQIASILEYNRLRGEISRIDALSYVPGSYDELIDEWMGRLIDRSAPDIQYFFNRAQRTTVMNPVTEDLFKSAKTIFTRDKVNYDYGNRRNMTRDVSIHTDSIVNDNAKPNRIHIDEYDNMYLTIDPQTENADLREIINDIPGLSVNDQGQVTANGTTVKKVYLNGTEISL
ncbi:MAG: M56 family metallopeptidase [Bacteroidaceae bacterium]|nr:M56 family metallopeptidase [Bacteroidaceae bacterium]